MAPLPAEMANIAKTIGMVRANIWLVQEALRRGEISEAASEQVRQGLGVLEHLAEVTRLDEAGIEEGS